MYRTRNYKGGNSDYEKVWCPIREKRLLTHHIAVGGCPKGKIVHHIDEIKWNNDPRNLKVMSRNKHYRHHANSLWESKENKMREGHKKYREDTQMQLKHSRKMKELWANGAYGVGAKECSIKDCTTKSNARGLCDLHYQRAKRAGTLPNRFSNKKNHRVLFIARKITKENVYDLTVPETENFALSSGVFVHNSKDVADAVCGAVYNAMEKSGGELGMVQTNTEELPENSNSADTITLKQKKELDAKEQHYKQLQEMLDAGLIQ